MSRRTIDFNDGFTSATPAVTEIIPATQVSNTPSGNLTSTDVQAALNELQTDVDTRATSSALTAHTSNVSNPHATTKAQVGLGNVDDTSDATKNAAVATLTNKTLTSPVLTGTVDGSAATTVSAATSNSASTITIGTGSGANTINIGGANSTIVLSGTTITENATNRSIQDKLITINKNGAVGSGAGTGFEIEENAAITGYFKTSGDRNSIEFKAPNTAGVATLTPGASPDSVTLNSATQTLTNKTLTTPSTDIVTLDGQAATPTNPAAGFYKAYVKDTNGKLAILNSAGLETEVGSGSGGNVNFISNGKAEQGTTGLFTYVSVQGFTPSNVDVATDTITITGHGLTDGTRVQFTNSGGALPAGLSASTDYYVRDAATNTFKVSLTNGGTAVDITTQGTGVHGVRPARPVALAGTSSAYVWSTSAVTPLQGTDSFLITVTAGNMGDGGRIPFTIDSAYKAKVLSISFDMMLSSGTYANGSSTVDSELIYGIYDVTNGVFIQPSNFKIDALNTNLSERFRAEFQTSSNSTSYQLFFHSAYGTNSYVAKVDNIAVSPNSYVFGSPVTDLFDAGPMTIGAIVTAPTKPSTMIRDKVLWTRRGPSGFYRYEYRADAATGSVAGSGDYLYSLPAGQSFNTSSVQLFTGSLASSTTGNWRTYGRISHGVDGTEFTFLGGIVPYDSTRFRILVINNGSVGNAFSSGSKPVTTANFGWNVEFEIPIAGWASSVQMADQTSTRIVALRVSAPASTLSTTIDTTINFPITTYDTHGAYNAGSYTVPVPGLYQISATEFYTSGSSYLRIFKNGVAIGTLAHANPSYVVAGSYSDYFVAGDVITIRTNATTSIAYTAGLYQCKIAIEKVSGPSQIAASEKVLFSGYSAAGGSSMPTANVSNMTATTQKDSHGAWTGSTYIIPTPGDFMLALVGLANAVATLNVYVDGVIYKKLCGVNNGGSWTSGTVSLPNMNVGQIISVRSDTICTLTGSATIASASHIEIWKLGGSN